MGVILPFRPNKLSFPGGLPGINPAHPAARGIVQASAVFQPTGNFIDVTRGLGGTVVTGVGAFTQIIDANIGPAMVPSSGTTNTNIVTIPKRTGTAFATTMAAIFRFPASTIGNAQIVGTTNSASFFQSLRLQSANLAYSENSSSQTLITWTGGSINLASSPCFVVFSVANQQWNSVLSVLSTGQIFTSSGTSVDTATSDPTSTVNIGNRVGDFGNPFNGGQIAAAMLVESIPRLLSIPEMLQFANDPWSFWYPNSFDLALSIKGAIAAGASPRNRTLMGVGL